MNITLFGGSFNPPHLGHAIVIEQAFELIPNIDELWILPCFKHTFLKNLAPAKHRLAMANLLINTLSPNVQTKVKCCPIEVDFRLSGETYAALQKLHSEREYLQRKMDLSDHNSLFPIHYSFLMGSDQLGGFTKWGHWEILLSELPFYIYPRAGYTSDLKFPNMTLLDSPNQVITNLSSTLIRERIGKRLPIAHLIQKAVLQYLRVHKLY